MLLNWTIQGVFLAGIYGNQPNLGPSMIIWTAAIAFVTTIPFPFLVGSLFFTKIYEKSVLKYDNQAMIKGQLDKQKN